MSESANTEMKLELVQVLFRHGIRTPSQHEASFFNITEPKIYEPYGFYQLTDEGKEGMHRLGRLLRKEYNDFLGDYKSEHLHALSSTTTRTKVSLEQVLSGLYPLPHYIGKDPIPYKAAVFSADVILTPHQFPKYVKTFRAEIEKSECYQKKMATFTGLIKTLEKHVGRSYEDQFFLYNCVMTYYIGMIHKLLNKPVPDWYTIEIYNRLKDLSVLIFDAMSLTKKLKKLNGGTMLRRMLENIESNKNAAMPKKIYLYSTHDLTVAAFTKCLNNDIFDIPPFSSCVILEKYRNEHGTEYVKMRYNDGSSEALEAFAIDDSTDYYPLSDFIKRFQDVMPTDEEIDFLISEVNHEESNKLIDNH